MYAGQRVGLAASTEPAGMLVRSMAAEALAVLRALARD
jgi:hypothetical protein